MIFRVFSNANRMRVAGLALGVAVLAAAPHYRQTGAIQIGGPGGWDYLYLDGGARRLYVSHATHVAVVDVDAGKVVGDIPDTAGVHGIAIAPKLNKGFTSNGRANTVTVFDLKTLKSTAQIKTGKNPDAILYEDSADRLFTFNGASKDMTVIEGKTGAVVQTVPLGGKPEFAVADGKGKVYVNIEDTAEVAEIDAAQGKVTKRYKLAGCEEPSGLAMDTAKRHLFSVCGNKVMVVSAPDSGKVVATLPIGEGSDGAGFDQSKGVAFSSNGEGTMTVVQQVSGEYKVIETVKTQQSARTMTVDPKTHKVYLPAAKYEAAPSGAAAGEGKGRQRPPMVADSFALLVMSE